MSLNPKKAGLPLKHAAMTDWGSKIDGRIFSSCRLKRLKRFERLKDLNDLTLNLEL
jgi:hypothetical protein